MVALVFHSWVDSSSHLYYLCSENKGADQLRGHREADLRKPTFCICVDRDADRLRGGREAGRRLCFRYIDSTVPLLAKCKISGLWSYFVAARPGLCRTGLEAGSLVFSWRGSSK